MTDGNLDGPGYDYSPIIRRPVLELPEGKRLAVWIGVATEHYSYGTPALSLASFTSHLTPDPLNHGWRDYGPRVGMWRLVDILERFEIPVTSLLNSEVVERYPQIVEEGRERGWCWVGHGGNNSNFMTGLDRQAERDHLQRVTDAIAAATGARPRGWIGPALTESQHTNEILAELGYTYTLNWGIDDEPIPLRAGARQLISVPYSAELNDLPLFVLHGQTGPDFRDALIDQFDQLLAEGAQRPRIMGFGVHPFLTGQPYRAKHFITALEHMVAHRRDVWFTTSDEIAAWHAATSGSRSTGAS
ncbi:MAG TPA: polysaccharide deacetylase family protein [Pseudonocardia sp.]|jgi:peptidoglycan/xylan/chitin deacetylase (PgdA/CDA1 family)|uniref:polysaccharide deacetylase family protein n=1 Tax=Pseudonocardia sp. TaxID=60912 RepID=UPI002F3EE743